MPKTTAEIVKQLQAADPVSYETPATRDGCVVRRLFWSTERYVFDFAPDFHADGWQQFDTDQDARYFGVWINSFKHMIVTYAEGDWMLVECGDRERYLRAIQRAIDFYGEGFIAKVIDQNGVTVYKQYRSKFLKEPPVADEPVSQSELDRRQIVALARHQWRNTSGVEIADDATVSRSEVDGAFVQASVFVPIGPPEEDAPHIVEILIAFEDNTWRTYLFQVPVKMVPEAAADALFEKYNQDPRFNKAVKFAVYAFPADAETVARMPVVGEIT